jgi:hypothetical protein
MWMDSRAKIPSKTGGDRTCASHRSHFKEKNVFGETWKILVRQEFYYHVFKDNTRCSLPFSPLLFKQLKAQRAVKTQGG